MNGEEAKNFYKKGVGIGIAIGALSVLLLCGILFGIVASRQREKIVESNRASLSLGSDVTEKINLLINLADTYFLYDYDKDEMADNLYKAVMNSLNDKYSVYYTPEEYAKLTESTEGVFYGIGTVVTKDEDTGYIRIVQVYEDSPADKAGIKDEDLITAVDGSTVKDMDLDMAIDMIRGEEGTTVTVTVMRGDEVMDVDIERGKIDIVTVSSEMLDNDIGYIQIAQFEGVTLNQFNEAFDELNEQGMKGLIIDLRDNPGGRLDTVTEILDRLLPEGVIVYTEDKNGNRDEIKSDAECDLNIPCVVLVNGNSASASEIFAGAMQDFGLGEIMGTQTFGKGIVQHIMGMEDGSAVKITVQNYYTPNGNNIHGIGITPDEVVELDEEAYIQDGIDTQFDAAAEYIKGQIK